MKALTIVSLCLIFTKSLFAQPSIQDPSEIDQKDAKQLRAGKVVVHLVKTHDSSGKHALAMGVMPAPPKVVWQVITDYAHYIEFMPRTIEGKILRQENSEVDLYTKLNMPWPVKDVSYVIRLLHDSQKQHISWKMVDGTGKGVKTNRGSWQLFPYEEGKTLAIYSLFYEPAGAVPSWLQNIATQKSARQALKAVAKRAITQSNSL